MVSRRRIVIIGAVVGLLLVGLIIFSIISNLGPKKAADESGGSGKPETGTLILKGFEIQDSSGISAGDITSNLVQTNIRALISADLKAQKTLDTYNAKIVDGSLSIDYVTNDVTYQVKSEDPATTYTVVFNTTSSGSLQVLKDNEPLDLD